MNNGDLAIEHNDEQGALREYAAAEEMFPDNLEMKFWHAVSLVNIGRLQQSLSLFREIFARDSNWTLLVPRLPRAGVLKADEAQIKEILSVAPER